MLLLVLAFVQLCTSAITLQNVVVSNSQLLSVQVNFGAPISSVTTSDFALYRVSGGVNVVVTPVSPTVTQVSSSVWVWSGTPLANGSGNYSISFLNTPPVQCTAIALNSKASTIVVGTGTPGSCTEAVLLSALATGGVVRFNCGTNLVSIPISNQLNITTNTTLDGGGLIELDGRFMTRIIAVNGNDYNKFTPVVTIQGVRFVHGFSTDVANTTATSSGGGAIYRFGGSLTILNCDFWSNTGPVSGQDVAGGAVYSVGAGPTLIYGSTFWNNSASNGGSIGNLGNSFSLYNSIILNSSATGNGGNPGNGGNGGGVSCDGANVLTDICGVTIAYTSFNMFGGSIFRVGYNVNADRATITKSYFHDLVNPTSGGFGALYLQTLNITITTSTIANAVSNGYGVFLGGNPIINLNQVTISSNTARTGLGGGLALGGATGVISQTTIAYNNQSFAAITGGSTGVTLTSSIVANNTAMNIWTPLSCFSGFGDGGNDFQYPPLRASGQVDTPLCTPTVSEVNPLLKAFDPVGGCIALGSGSPAAGKGANLCSARNSAQLSVWQGSNQPLPRTVVFGLGVGTNSATIQQPTSY